MEKFYDIYESIINEALITFGNKRPKFNQVVILAGGAGSGKGFVKDKLLGIEGRTFDVDYLKSMVLKSNLYRQKVKAEFGYDLKDLKLSNPKDVTTLHNIVSELKLLNKRQENVFKSIMVAEKDRKPNLIFDVTMKDLKKLDDISHSVQELGYDAKDIHVVWVINDIEVAKAQNLARERKVKEDILVDTHRGVSYTISNIIKDGNVQKFMDGDFWFVFNKRGVDSLMSSSLTGGSYIKKTLYTKAKARGKKMKKLDEIGDEFVKKIKSYVPDEKVWDK